VFENGTPWNVMDVYDLVFPPALDCKRADIYSSEMGWAGHLKAGLAKFLEFG